MSQTDISEKNQSEWEKKAAENVRLQMRLFGDCAVRTQSTGADISRFAGASESVVPIQAICFDLDGSLIDSMWVWGEIDVEYLGRLGIEKPDSLRPAIEGMSFHETAVYFKETFHLEDSVDRIKEDWTAMAWEKYGNDVPLKPGAAEFLAKCKACGIKLAIATSNARDLAEHVLSARGVLEDFDVLITGSEIVQGKPAPDVYVTAAKRLQTPPAACLVFEDIVAGIKAGRAAGMEVCVVQDAYSAGTDDEKLALAEYAISDFYQLL